MQYVELLNVIDTFEDNRIPIIHDWLELDSILEVLEKYDITGEFLRGDYADAIFQYYMNIVRGIEDLGHCISMNNFLNLLLVKNIIQADIYTLCTSFRRVLINFSFDNFTVSKTLVNEITYIADINFNGVLSRYEEILSQKNKNYDDQSVILEQHKQIVDISAIVSKTNPSGKITYVNQNFCEISGYAAEELLGKPHSITRHKDESDETFKDLWKTITNKKAWHGDVKNHTKTGDVYIVSTHIMPILNAEGEIVEYISVRYDVTELYKLKEEIEDTQKEILNKMGTISETRSEETGNHVKRVASYSKILGREYGLKDQDVELLYQASPMHDIGKVAVPDSILNKPGKLTKEEFEVMKTHAEIGYHMFNKSSRPLLNLVAVIANEHHEKWDGSGYPRGLVGEDISIYGRITALADVFDALGSDRVYKKAWDDEKLFKFIQEQSEKHFDPSLVKIFFRCLDEILVIRENFKD